MLVLHVRGEDGVTRAAWGWHKVLDSQFATLEEPTAHEHPIVADVGGAPPEIVAEIVRQLRERGP